MKKILIAIMVLLFFMAAAHVDFKEREQVKIVSNK